MQLCNRRRRQLDTTNYRQPNEGLVGGVVFVSRMAWKQLSRHDEFAVGVEWRRRRRCGVALDLVFPRRGPAKTFRWMMSGVPLRAMALLLLPLPLQNPQHSDRFMPVSFCPCVRDFDGKHTQAAAAAAAKRLKACSHMCGCM